MTSPTNKIKQIEKVLGTPTDGVWGDDDRMALKILTKPKAAPPQQAQTAPMGVSQMNQSADVGAAPTTYK